MALSLGDISFALGADTSGLDRAAQKLAQFSQKVDDAARRTGEGSEQVAAAYKKQEAAITSAFNKVLNLNASITRSGVGTAEMYSQTSAALQRYTTSLGNGAVSALVFQRANERLALSLGSVNRGLAAAKSSNQTPFGDLGKFGEQLKNLSTLALLVTGPLGGIASRIAAFATVATHAGIATATMVAGIAIGITVFDKLAKAALEAGNAVDQITESMFAVIGNQVVVNQSLKDLIAIANQSGYKVQQLGEEWVNFMETTKGTSLAGAKAEEVFRSVALTLGTLHRTPEQAAGAFKTLQLMMDNTVVSAMQLKRQLAADIPGAMEIAARAMNMSPANFTNALKKGLIETEDFLPKFAAELKKTFTLGSEVDTDEAALARLHNANLLFLNDLDKQLSISEGAKSLYKGLADVVDRLRGALESMSPAIKSVITGFASFAGLTAVFLAVAQGVRLLAVSLGLLGAASLLSPIGWIATALIAVTAALGGGIAAWKEYKAAQESAVSTIKSTTEATNEYVKALHSLGKGNDAVMAGNVQWQLQKKAVEEAYTKLKEMQDKMAPTSQYKIGVVTDLSQIADIQKLSKAQKEYTDAQKALLDLEKAIQVSAPHSPPFISDDQIRKLQEAHDKLAELNDEIIKGQNALDSGGLVAYNRLKETFADNKKVLEYAKALDALPASYRQNLMSVDEYRRGLEKFTISLDKAKLAEQAMKDLQNAAGHAFSTIGMALEQLVSKGKFDFQALADAARSAAADILNTFLTLAVMNPLKNSIFGLNGTSGQLPSLGGLGGFFGSLLGGGGGAGSGGGMSDAGFTSFLDGLKFAKGGAFNHGIRFLADGGILNGPTMFNTSSGLAVGGEAGTEAVMPLVRGPGGKLGVMNHGGGGTNVNVTIQAPNPAAFAHPSSQAQVANAMRKAISAAGRNA